MQADDNESTSGAISHTSAQVGAAAAAKEAAVTNVTIDGMNKLLDMAGRVANKEIRYRDGHIFEAILAHKENVQFVRSGSDVRTVLTHLENDHRNAADLVRRLDGEVLSQAQAKFSEPHGTMEPLLVPRDPQKLSSFARLLADPKYADMDLYVQSRDMELVRAELLRKSEASLDPAIKQRYLDAAKRVVDHDTSAVEVRAARQAPEWYALQTELSALGIEVAVAAGTAAAVGGIVGGAISLTKNLFAVSSGDLTLKQGMANVTKDSGKAGVRSGATGALGTVIRYGGQKASYGALGKANVATAVAASVIDAGATILAYTKGEISGQMAIERLGQNGTSTMSSIYVGAAAGAVFGPIGAVAGSIAGYMVASALYTGCLACLRSSTLADEQAEVVEKICREAADAMRAEQAYIENFIEHQLAQQKQAFSHCFSIIDKGQQTSSPLTAIDGISQLLQTFGQKLLFESFEDFDSFMGDSESSLSF